MATAALHHLFNDGSVVVLPTIFPILLKETELLNDYSGIGNMMMVGLFVAVGFQLLLGHSARRRHSRYYLAADAFLVGISLLLMTLAQNYLMLVLFFLGVRMGTSIYHPVGISWISHTFRGRNLDRAMGVQSASGNVGVLIAFTTTGVLVHYFGWRAPLYGWGVFNLLAVAGGLILSRGAIDRNVTEAPREKVSWRETFGTVGKFIPMILLSGTCWGISVNYSSSLLNRGLGISMDRTGVILGFWMAAGTAAAFFYGYVSGKLDRIRTIILAYSVMVISTLVLGLSDNAALTTVFFIVYGTALFTTYPANLSFVGSTVKGRNRTAAFSLVSNIMIIGNSIFSFIAGRMSDRFGIHSPFLSISAFSFVLIAYVAIMKRAGGMRPADNSVKDIAGG